MTIFFSSLCPQSPEWISEGLDLIYVVSCDWMVRI